MRRTYISQKTLEKADGVSAGKYIKGLEQEAMAFCGDREDIVSTFLSAASGLLRKYNIDPSQIGRLECGTETLIDKSKVALVARLHSLSEPKHSSKRPSRRT